jgi:hypothetical protein
MDDAAERVTDLRYQKNSQSCATSLRRLMIALYFAPDLKEMATRTLKKWIVTSEGLIPAGQSRGFGS